MAADARQRADFGVHGNVLVKNAHLPRALHQGAPQRALGLVAHEQHGVAAVPQVVLQMVADAPRVAHAAGGQNNLWPLVGVDGLRFLFRKAHGQAAEPKRVDAALYQGAGLGVQIGGGALQKDAGGLVGKRAVHIYGEAVEPLHKAFFFNFADEVQHFLGAAHGKRRNYHRAAAAQRALQHLRKGADGIGPLAVRARAVGGFQHHIIGLLHGLRVVDDGLVGVAHVAAEDNFFLHAALAQPQLGRGPAGGQCR